jgi:hypothetical protein
VGNNLQVVDYREVQFTRPGDPARDGPELIKRRPAELRDKGLLV